ncbi:hypothetical protein K7432_013258 [Basidiobolus ranarum]|uniref:Uncharacterized protein n=1 Tax=Basidiobolus ranarum TaxID=34480 RepID=A0ABR2WJJ5_9FUNG
MVSPRSVSSSSHSTNHSADTFSVRSRRSSMSSHTSYTSSGSQKCSVVTDNSSRIPNLLFQEGQLSQRTRFRARNGALSPSTFKNNKENISVETPTPLSRQTTKLPEGVWYCQVPPRPAFFPYHNNSVFLPTGKGQELVTQLSAQPTQEITQQYTVSDTPARKIRRRSYSGTQLASCPSREILPTVVSRTYTSCHGNDSRTSLPGSLTQEKLNLLRKIRQMITNKKKSSVSKKKSLLKFSVTEIKPTQQVLRNKKRRSVGEPLIAGPEYSKIHAC